MTPGEFAAIEARANAATEGPWGVDHQPNHHPDDPEWTIESWSMKFDDPVGIVDEGVSQGHADAEFIAQARVDVPALLAAVRERDNTIARVRKCINDYESLGTRPWNALRAALDPQETE